MKQMAVNTYWKFWRILAKNELQRSFVNRYTNMLFWLGKMIRFSMGLLFLILIKNSSHAFGLYTPNQAIVFFLSYQFLDTLIQAIYRGSYIFGEQVKSGEFDLFLAQPIHPLFRALMGKPDINDVAFIIPSTLISLWLISTLNLDISLINIALYCSLLINAFLIATALHIAALSIGILTTEVDNIMWIYRDFNRMGQFPVDIYQNLLRLSLFFVIPIGFMNTIPVQVLLGRTPTFSLAIAWLIGAIFLFGSLLFWRFAIRRYSSVGS